MDFMTTNLKLKLTGLKDVLKALSSCVNEHLDDMDIKRQYCLCTAGLRVSPSIMVQYGKEKRNVRISVIISNIMPFRYFAREIYCIISSPRQRTQRSELVYAAFHCPSRHLLHKR